MGAARFFYCLNTKEKLVFFGLCRCNNNCFLKQSCFLFGRITDSFMAEILVEKLTSIVEPIVADLQLELVALQFRKEQHGWVLRIIIYAEDGITIDHCKSVSKEVSYLLDVEDFIIEKYHLEVTSPGLDRPLTTPRDFERNIDKNVKVTLDDGTEVVSVAGIIKKIEDENITLLSDNEEIEFHYTEVKKAKLVIDFGKSGKRRK